MNAIIILLRNELIQKGVVTVRGSRVIWWLIDNIHPSIHYINRNTSLGYSIWSSGIYNQKCSTATMISTKSPGLIQKHTNNKLQQVGMILSLMLNRKVGTLDFSGFMDPLKLMQSMVSFPNFPDTADNLREFTDFWSSLQTPGEEVPGLPLRHHTITFQL